MEKQDEALLHPRRVGDRTLALALPAIAQDIRVNVNGTNIRGVETETAAPIETITRKDIQASGLQASAAVVQALTANNNGTISNAFVNGFAAGASGVSRRGLGANNTLVLLDVHAELSNFQSKVSTQFTPQAVRSTWYSTARQTVISSANIYLPVGHPGNPFSANIQVARLYYTAGGVGGRNRLNDPGIYGYTATARSARPRSRLRQLQLQLQLPRLRRARHAVRCQCAVHVQLSPPSPHHDISPHAGIAPACGERRHGARRPRTARSFHQGPTGPALGETR